MTGGRAGLSFNFGSTVNRLGVFIAGYYAYDFVQINSGVHFYYNFNSYGPPEARPEWQIHLGGVVAYGRKEERYNPFINSISNQTDHPNSIGYAHHWYLEKISPQRTGTLALQFGRWEIISENDALSGQGQDKFRTGTLQLAFRDDNARYALQTILWTGNTHGPKTCRIKSNQDYPCRFGYKDISKAHCGGYSHGILALEYQHYLGYGQTASLAMGIDAEQVRHFLQNKLIHDMYFWPRQWNKAENPHLPMLDQNGKPYLFQPGQQIRSPKWYFNLGANSPLFY